MLVKRGEEGKWGGEGVVRGWGGVIGGVGAMAKEDVVRGGLSSSLSFAKC